MENTGIEMLKLEEAAEHATAEKLKELCELQLALVGGGGGDVVFA